MTSRRIGWLAMAAVLAVALFFGVNQDRDSRTKRDRVLDLSEQLMCPTCRGQAVADSTATSSNAIRAYISTRIDEGASDGEIIDELSVKYPGIVLTPEKSGLASLVWTLPIAVLVAALAGVGLAFRRWRQQPVAHATDADRALVERAREELHAR